MNIDGFSFSAVSAEIKYKDRLDLGLIYSDTPCVAAGVYTTSQVKAAPVRVDMERIKSGKVQAILVNSGCANACTGERGMETALHISELVAAALDVEDSLVQLASTGVIGEQLDPEKFEKNISSLVAGLSTDGFTDVARAIMTTDTVHKTAEREIQLGGRNVKLMGMAKGSGMIMPNMATMLAFVVTDANISRTALDSILKLSTERTFNRITVDGDTSTNDMVLLLANGKAANPEIILDSEGFQALKDVVEDLLKDLALQIVADGEGASKTITICVKGAGSDEDAEKLARTVANSNLVKTAFFGEDANWGRIFGALGRAGVAFDESEVDLYFGDVQLVRNGLGLSGDAEAQATEVLKKDRFTVTVDMGVGDGYAEVYTCDFSLDYVKINADYRS